jgi:hypothetical protein
MGIADAYDVNLPQPLPDPNAPTIAWGSPQAHALVKQQQASYDPGGLKALDAMGQKIATDNAARANAVQFSGGAPGGAAGAPPPDEPLHLPNANPTYATIKAHDVQLGSDTFIDAKKRAADAAKAALTGTAQARVEENEANQQAMVGHQGTMNQLGVERDKADADTMAKTAKAHDEYAKSSDIDPDHYQSSMSTGKRALLMASGALMQMGMGLQGNHGKNPILEQIEQETHRDIEAQKSARDKKLSLYHQAREAGLDEKQAHALTYQMKAEQSKLGMEAAIAGNHSPVLTKLAEQQAAAVDDSVADTWGKAYGRAQQQTVATSAGIPKEVKDLAAKIRTDANFKGTDEQALASAARTLGLNYGGGRGEFEDKMAAAKKAEGAGRGAGVALDYQTRLSNINQVKLALKDARTRLEEGYHPTDTTADQIHSQLAAEYAKMLKGGASASDNEVEDAKAHMIPSLNHIKTGNPQFESFRKQLDRIEASVAEREADLKKAGPAIAGGQGLQPGQSLQDLAAETGAVQR